MSFKEILRKLQSQPAGTKKIILWVVTGLLGAGLLVWWGAGVKGTLEKVRDSSIEDQFQIQKLQKNLDTIPVEFNGEQQ